MDSNAFRDKYDELANAFKVWRTAHPNATAAEFARSHYDIFDLPLWNARMHTDGGNPDGQPPPPPPQ